MSHTVTVRTTTTTASTSAIIVNTGFIRTWSGLLKLFETILGAVILGLIGYYSTHNSQMVRYYGFSAGPEETLMFLVSFGFLLTTFLLLLTSMCSLMTSSVLPKTLFEFVYHVFAFIFYLSAGLALIVVVSKRNDSRYRTEYGYEGKMAAAVLGLINAALYFLSAFFSFRGYRIG